MLAVNFVSNIFFVLVIGTTIKLGFPSIIDRKYFSATFTKKRILRVLVPASDVYRTVDLKELAF